MSAGWEGLPAHRWPHTHSHFPLPCVVALLKNKAIFVCLKVKVIMTYCNAAICMMVWCPLCSLLISACWNVCTRGSGCDADDGGGFYLSGPQLRSGWWSCCCWLQFSLNMSWNETLMMLWGNRVIAVTNSCRIQQQHGSKTGILQITQQKLYTYTVYYGMPFRNLVSVTWVYGMKHLHILNGTWNILIEM